MYIAAGSIISLRKVQFTIVYEGIMYPFLAAITGVSPY